MSNSGIADSYFNREYQIRFVHKATDRLNNWETQSVDYPIHTGSTIETDGTDGIGYPSFTSRISNNTNYYRKYTGATNVTNATNITDFTRKACASARDRSERSQENESRSRTPSTGTTTKSTTGNTTPSGSGIIIDSGCDCAIGFDLCAVFFMTTILRIIGSLCLSHRFKSNALYNEYANKVSMMTKKIIRIQRQQASKHRSVSLMRIGRVASHYAAQQNASLQFSANPKKNINT